VTTDSTKVHSLANGKKPAADGDASWKKYEHRYKDEQGQPRKSVVKWFGYKLHLVWAHPCPRSTLSPMCPVQTPAAPPPPNLGEAVLTLLEGPHRA